MKYIIANIIFVLLAYQTMSLPETMLKRSGVIIGGTLYFTDPSATLRSRAEALAYCQSEGAELAKVTNKQLYDTLRLAFSLQATYWIDGIDKGNSDRFVLDNSCNSGEFDYSQMQPNNLVLTPKQCLALVKGSSAANSRIQAVDCVIPNRVLCSLSELGCNGGTTTPVVTAPTQISTMDFRYLQVR